MAEEFQDAPKEPLNKSSVALLLAKPGAYSEIRQASLNNFWHQVKPRFYLGRY